MLHTTNADGKPGSNPSPLSLAEVRRVFVEAPNLTFLNIVLSECVSNLLFTGVVPFDKDESLEVLAEWKRLQRAAIHEAFNNFTRQIEQLPVWPFTESKAKFLHRLFRGRSDCLRLVTVFTDASCWGVHRSQWNHLDQRDYEKVMDFLDWLKAVEVELVGLEGAVTPLAKIITPEPTGPTADPGPAPPPSDPGARGKGVRGANIDARMLKVLSERPESLDWSCRQWAEHLGCACSTVAGTKTWKIRIPQVRSLHQAERIRRGSRR
jgi:hypothetical protein